MKWINPRDQLPELDKLIWVCQVWTSDEKYPGIYVFLCRTIHDPLTNNIVAERIHYKGYAEYIYYHFLPSISKDEDISEDYRIWGWLYLQEKDIPSWEYII